VLGRRTLFGRPGATTSTADSSSLPAQEAMLSRRFSTSAVISSTVKRLAESLSRLLEPPLPVVVML
jgi:hypothetical protein